MAIKNWEDLTIEEKEVIIDGELELILQDTIVKALESVLWPEVLEYEGN